MATFEQWLNVQLNTAETFTAVNGALELAGLRQAVARTADSPWYYSEAMAAFAPALPALWIDVQNVQDRVVACGPRVQSTAAVTVGIAAAEADWPTMEVNANDYAGVLKASIYAWLRTNLDGRTVDGFTVLMTRAVSADTEGRPWVNSPGGPVYSRAISARLEVPAIWAG